MAKKGVPWKASHKVKSASMLVRLTESDKAAYVRAAERAGLELSTWVRLRLNDAVEAEKPKKREAPITGS